MNKIIPAALCMLMAAACNESEQNAEHAVLKGEVRIDGSGTVYPISEAIAEAFRSEQKQVKVMIGNSGSGAGFKKFARGETDISDASRAIKEKEIQACRENGIAYTEFRVALDGIALVVNKNNNWAEALSTEELKMIWESNSTVRKWSDIRAEWPDEDMHLYGPNSAHGTYDFFTEEICGESGSRSDYNAVTDYNVAVQGISRDLYALGYFGLAYYTENKDKLKLLGVDNGQGVVLPSLETVGNGRYSPLSRPLYIYVKNASAEKPAVQAFVRFYLAHVKEVAGDVGYIPLSSEAYDEAMESFKRVVSVK